MVSSDLRALRLEVASLKEDKAPLIEEMLARYESNRVRIAEAGFPIIAFCGHGRSGKDLAAKWLSGTYGVRYVGSVSHAVSPLIAESLGMSREEAFESRHDDRMYWFEWCNALRRDDPALLVKLTLAENDMVAGIRGDVELHACKAQGVIDLAIWVDNPRVEKDPTVEFSVDDCDLVIRNSGGRLSYFNRLKLLCDYLGFKGNIENDKD